MSIFEEGVGADLINQILSNPLGLTQLESWMLFGVGMLFATITLVDVITFSDIYPGYTKVQKKWDEFTDDYKDEYDALKEELDDIKEEYANVLKAIGNSLSARLQHLDHIMSGRTRLQVLYDGHHELLQRAANALFSYYYEANRAARTDAAPERFNKRYIVAKMVLSSGKTIQPREAQKIKDRIAEGKTILDEQLKTVLDEYAKGINQYRNLDILNEEYEYGEEPKVKKEAEPVQE